MSQQDRFAGILSSLNEAALDDSLWPAASGRIDEACGMRGNTLVMAEGHSQTDIEILFARVCHDGERDEDWEQTYFGEYYPTDERVPRVSRLPDGHLVHVADLYTEEERKTSETYNKSLPLGGYQNGLNVRLDGPDGIHIIWALADSTERGGWGGGQIAMIESLLPHLRHFLRVRQALGGAQALNASLLRHLDDTRFGIITLDRRGRIVETNGRARDLLLRGSGLFEHEGLLRARVRADDCLLQGLLAAALPRFGFQAAGGSMTVFSWLSRLRQVVHVIPAGDRQKDFAIGRAAAMVLVVEPGSPEQLNAKLVASALGLTPTESRVAVALAMGKTATRIADERGLKLSTVWYHLKQIYAKLGLSRQVDLVRLVLSLGDAPRSQCR